MTLKAMTLALAATASLAAYGQPAWAQMRTFDMPAMPANRALPLFAKQAGLQIIAPASALTNLRTPAIKGARDARSALRSLIAGTGLEIASDADGIITLRSAPAPKAPDQAAASSVVDEVVVTGRAGNTERRKVESSYAISTISAAELQIKAPRGVTEALKNVPGFWIESSGGEASGNVRVRGIPNDGFSSIALQEDGLTIQHDAGLGYLNADQAFRMDSTIKAVEVVRGGPSAIFASNAPGATVNFITREGGDHLEGFVKYEGSSYGSNRLDGWVGGPIGDTPWRYFVGGFYRISDGERPSGYLQDQGGQIRATVNRDFDWGSLMFGVKRIDDRVGFDTDTPFVNDAGGNPVGAPGFNALTDTIAGDQTRYFNFREPNGQTYKFDNAVGTTVKLTQLTGELKLNLADGFVFKDNMRYRSSWTRRNDVQPYSAYQASTLLSAFKPYISTVPGGASLGYVYTDNPSQPFTANQNGNGLALVDLIRSFTVPESEFVNDGRFQKTSYIFGQKHDFAFGGYYAHIDETYQATSATAITDVKNNASLLDIYVLDAAGKPLQSLTENGILSYGAEYANGHGTSDTGAAYVSDEWQFNDKLRFDGGVRYEYVKTQGAVEGDKAVNLGQSATAADNSVLVGTGVFTPYSRQYSHTAWTLGANYQFRPDIGVFARYTSAFRLPSVGDFITNANDDPVVQKMTFIESGLKVAERRFDFYATGFRSLYKSYAITDYTLTNGVYSGRTVYGNTETWGAEFEGTWRPVRWFDLHGQYTWQNPQFSQFIYTNSSGVLTTYTGNQLIRVPKNTYRITPGVNLLDGKLRIESDVSYYGLRYADVANDIKLPAYMTVDMYAQYKFTQRLTFNLYINNLTNAVGLDEGNPRAGTIDNTEVGASTYLARSIMGRSYRGAVSYKF